MSGMSHIEDMIQQFALFANCVSAHQPRLRPRNANSAASSNSIAPGINATVTKITPAIADTPITIADALGFGIANAAPTSPATDAHTAPKPCANTCSPPSAWFGIASVPGSFTHACGDHSGA